MQLVIVESPTKAKTLGRFLGSEYNVQASMGHVRDLPKSNLGIDVEHDFLPTYEIDEKKQELVQRLIAAGGKAERIVIATDPDREGEAIGFHVQTLLTDALKNGKKHPDFVRATFHEITKSAIADALAHPGKLNFELVDAQQARRVLDRLVGYKLSPVLWKKVRRGLSAGRVQSVAVRLIVDREKEILAFVPVEFWEISALTRKSQVPNPKSQNKEFRIDLYKVNNKTAQVTNGEQAAKIVADLKKAIYKVESITRREVDQNPMPPFITSTMQRAAANAFGWSSKNTMRQAQQLYEHGYITYHRTDSVNLSNEALAMAAEYIEKEYGKSYYTGSRHFKKQSKLAQEAHEAIRPSLLSRSLETVEETCGSMGKRLYQLISNRFLSSQMAACRVAKTTVLVKADADYQLRAVGEIQLFDGWRKVYGNVKDEESIMRLPELTQGENLDLLDVLSEQKFTQPPARYTESTLIKALEQRSIGRPSTYAPTISTIQDRQYVEKIEKNFKPTQVGMAVTEFLNQNFAQIMDYDFTAKVEEELDDIAVGKRQWVPVIREFFDPFQEKVKHVEKNAERVKIDTEKTGEKCPDCKEGDIVIRVGRFGKFLSCSRFPDCKYTKNFVEKLENLTCPDCGNGEIVVKRTRTGRSFYGCSNYPNCKWASWNKPKVGEDGKVIKEENNGKWVKKTASKGVKAKGKGKSTKTKRVSKINKTNSKHEVRNTKQ